MAIPYWTAQKAYGSFITNIQTVTMTNGRRVLTDNYSAGRATVNGRRPDLLPTIDIGDVVWLTLNNPNTSPTQTFFRPMRVSDLQITYGTVAAMDTWTLTLEDAFALLGRATINYTWSAGKTTLDAITEVCVNLGIGYTDSVCATPKTISATTVSNANALNVVQNLINTEQGLLAADAYQLFFTTRNWQSQTVFHLFGDAGGASSPYQQVQFLSMADNYATYVLVTINGGTPTVSGTGIYSYNLDSYALNATDALSIAQYVKGALQDTSATPNTLSVLLNTDTIGRTLDALSLNAGVTLTLRGQTYTANIIGWTISSTPEQTRVTFQLAGTEQYNYLVLNDSVYGTLDNNRLGF